MFPKSNQPGKLYDTAKTPKFNSIEDITLENLKFCPIIAQSGTYTYKAAQVMADYLKPLCSDNDYIIRNTQEFTKLLQQQDPLLPNKECVSYDVKFLFTNVSIQETIDYILDEIHVKSELPLNMLKVNIQTFAIKINNGKYFHVYLQFLQTDGCTMGGPFSVIFSYIYSYIYIYIYITNIYIYIYDQNRTCSCQSIQT